MSKDIKFKEGDPVIIKGLLMNGTRMDVQGTIVKFHTQFPYYKGKYLVDVRGTYVNMEPERLEYDSTRQNYKY